MVLPGKKWLNTALIITGASSWYWIKYVYAYLVFGVERYNTIPFESRQWLISVSVVALCALLALVISSFKVKEAVQVLGLNRDIVTAILLAVCCTIPMYIGGWIYAEGNNDFGIVSAIEKAIWPGFTEELVFRGFVTGLLVRKAGWHFIPAVLLSAVAFAWGHLYQAADTGEAVIVFLVTSGAGIGFAIFYKMWGWNLWFPIFMHIFMNLSFAIFHIGDNVLLSGTANIFRGITILLAILASIFINYRNKKKQAFEPRTA